MNDFLSFESPIAGSTLLAVGGVLSALAVGAYILKMRRRRFEVPFSALWRRVLQESQTTSLWHRLKRLLSLLLQLAIVGLLVFAAANPLLGRPPDDARNVVVIIDSSASMRATDVDDKGDEALTRLDVAKERARELIDSLGGGDAAMIIRMDGRTTPLTRFESDKAPLIGALDRIEATDTPADLGRALQAAADALRDRQNPLVVLIGDGAYREDQLGAVRWDPVPAGQSARLDTIDMAGIDVRFLPVGSSGENLGIVAFNVRRYITNKLAYEVFIEVQNFGDQPAKARLTLFGGASPIEVKELELAAGERKRHLFPNLSGGDGFRLRATLEPVEGAADPFALDDRAFALLPERKQQRVLLVTADNLYLEGAMLVYDNIVVDKWLPEEYHRLVGTAEMPAYDAVVFDGHTPAVLPARGNLLYFAPSGEHSPFPVRRSLPNPLINEWDENHPVMRWLSLSDAHFDEVDTFELDRGRGDVALARSARAVVGAAARAGGRKIVAWGFSLNGTDLVLRVAFPLLLVNTLDWFAGDDADLITTYSTGQRFRVPIDATLGIDEVEVVLPGRKKTKAAVSDGRATFYGTRVGVHELRADGRSVAELAANLANPDESDIEPSETLILGGRTLEPPAAFESSRRRAIWIYLVLAAVLLLAAEWLTYNRRVTV